MSSDQIIQWKHKLYAAFISGASSGVVACVGVNFIDTDFSPTTIHGALKTLSLLVVTVIGKGIMKAAGFMEANPSPWDGISERRNGAANGNS